MLDRGEGMELLHPYSKTLLRNVDNQDVEMVEQNHIITNSSSAKARLTPYNDPPTVHENDITSITYGPPRPSFLLNFVCFPGILHF